MERHPTCYEHTQINKEIFRNILRDIKEMAGLGRESNILENFDTEADLETLLQKCPYSVEGINAVFETIEFRRGPFSPDNKDFEYSKHRKLKENEAIIKFQTTFNGGTKDSSLLYQINQDNSVKYIGFVESGFHLSNKIKLSQNGTKI